MADTTLAFTEGSPHHLAGTGTIVHDGPASKRIVTGYGFWIFLLSDIVMFSCFFAAYAVLVGQTAGGPHGSQLFDLRSVAAETGLPVAVELHLRPCHHRGGRPQRALVSGGDGGDLRSRACVSRAGRARICQLWSPKAPARHGAPSCPPSLRLVGCHGMHVSAGILWLLTMMAQVFAKGFRADIQRRLLCFALFWHALDIIWVAVFSVVYLLGSAV